MTLSVSWELFCRSKQVYIRQTAIHSISVVHFKGTSFYLKGYVYHGKLLILHKFSHCVDSQSVSKMRTIHWQPRSLLWRISQSYPNKSEACYLLLTLVYSQLSSSCQAKPGTGQNYCLSPVQDGRWVLKNNINSQVTPGSGGFPHFWGNLKNSFCGYHSSMGKCKFL